MSTSAIYVLSDMDFLDLAVAWIDAMPRNLLIRSLVAFCRTLHRRNQLYLVVRELDGLHWSAAHARLTSDFEASSVERLRHILLLMASVYYRRMVTPSMEQDLLTDNFDISDPETSPSWLQSFLGYQQRCNGVAEIPTTDQPHMTTMAFQLSGFAFPERERERAAPTASNRRAAVDTWRQETAAQSQLDPDEEKYEVEDTPEPEVIAVDSELAPDEVESEVEEDTPEPEAIAVEMHLYPGEVEWLVPEDETLEPEEPGSTFRRNDDTVKLPFFGRKHIRVKNVVNDPEMRVDTLMQEAPESEGGVERPERQCSFGEMTDIPHQVGKTVHEVEGAERTIACKKIEVVDLTQVEDDQNQEICSSKGEVMTSPPEVAKSCRGIEKTTRLSLAQMDREAFDEELEGDLVGTAERFGSELESTKDGTNTSRETAR